MSPPQNEQGNSSVESTVSLITDTLNGEGDCALAVLSESRDQDPWVDSGALLQRRLHV